MTPMELREHRKRLGLSQVKLAEALGVTQHTVSRWEEGKMRLTAPRSFWLDAEIARIATERRPKRARRQRPKARRTEEASTVSAPGAPAKPDVSLALARALAEVEECRAAGDAAGAERWEQIAAGIAASAAAVEGA